jgi:hypothetical protein
MVVNGNLVVNDKLAAKQALPAPSESAINAHPLKLTKLVCGWTNTLATDRLES